MTSALVLTLLIFAAAPTDSARWTTAPIISEVKHPTGVQGLRVEFDLQAPPDRALDLLWDVASLKKMFPDVKSATVAGKCGEACIFVDFVVDGVIKEVRYRLRRERNTQRGRIDWQMVSGDLSFIQGSWHITAIDGGAHVTYLSFVDVAGPIPTAWVRGVAMGKATRLVDSVRAGCTQAPGTTPSK